jgi:sulfur-oxidizing protein SoxX
MRKLLLVALIAALGGPGRAAEPVVAYTIVNGAEITASLTGAPGDAARGRVLYAGEARAGCPACHGLPGVPGEATAAPDLSGVGGRLSAGAIRLWIVAPVVLASETTMPAYYAAGQRDGADDPLYGGPALTAAEIEDLVAYLASLGDPG